MKKVKLEIVIAEELVQTVVEAIETHSHTGSPGDGKIFIITVDDVVRMSTHELWITHCRISIPRTRRPVPERSTRIPARCLRC